MDRASSRRITAVCLDAHARGIVMRLGNGIKRLAIPIINWIMRAKGPLTALKTLTAPARSRRPFCKRNCPFAAESTRLAVASVNCTTKELFPEGTEGTTSPSSFLLYSKPGKRKGADVNPPSQIPTIRYLVQF